MYKITLCFILLMSFSVHADIIEDMFSGKKPSTTKCFDFSKPAKLKKSKTSKANKRNKRKNKRNRSRAKAKTYKVELCVPELTKQMDKNDRKIESLEKKMDSLISVGNVRNRAAKVSARRNKKKWRLSLDCESYTNSGRKKLCLFEKMSKKSMSSKRRDRLNAKYIEKLVKNFSKITDLDRMELISAYRDYVEVYEPKKLEALEALDLEDISDSKTFIKSIESSKFLKVYAQESLPEYQALLAQVESLEEDNELLIKQQDHICNKKRDELNSCPQVQSQFLKSINPDSTVEDMEEGFKQMIGMLGGFKYGPKDNPEEQLYVDVTADGYKDFKKIVSGKKYITQQRQVDFIESRFDKAKVALDNFEYNQKNKDRPGFKPKKVTSVCGGCRDLKKMFEEAKETKNTLLQNKLFELDKQLGCGVVKQSRQSCEEQVSKVLQDNKFNPEDGSKLVTLDSAMGDLKRIPSHYGKPFDSAFDEILSLVYVDEKKGVESCGSCQLVKDQIDSLGEFKESKVLSKEGIEITKDYFKLKDKKDSEYFKSLEAIAIKNNCIEIDEYEVEPENSCQSHVGYFQKFLLENSSMDAVSSDKMSEYNEKLASLREFESSEGKTCCDEIINNIESKEDIYNKTFLMNDSKLSLAESLQCLSCGQGKKSEHKIETESLKTSVSSCDFYKKYVEKASIDRVNQFRIDGKPYSVSGFMETEVYTCKDGPKKSLVNPARDWETIAYSEYGKYGAHADLDLQCYIDPTTGESVNLSCCNIKPNSRQFDRLKDVLSKSDNQSSDFKSNNKAFSSSEKLEELNSQFADKKVQTFCKETFGKYDGEIEQAKTKDWKICVDRKGKEFFKVSSFQNILGKKLESGTTEKSKVDEAR